MKKKTLLEFMNKLGFDIVDVGMLGTYEVVGKKCQDGRIVWWKMEQEGSGFERLFKGAIKEACYEERIQGSN